MKKLKEIQGGMSVISMVTVFTLTIAAFGCRKSARETAEEKAIERHKQETAHGQMASPAMQAAFSNYFRTPEGMRVDSALTFLKSQKSNGLPGIPKGTKAMFRLEKNLRISHLKEAARRKSTSSQQTSRHRTTIM